MLTIEEWVLCGNPLQWSGCGSDPDLEPNREFGPVADTTVAGMSYAYLPREAANASIVEVCNHAPLILPKMQNLKSLTLI